jgi:hypothetical protein
MGSGLYRRSWTSLPTTFISAQRLSERTVALNGNLLPKRKRTFEFLNSRKLTYWEDGWQAAFQGRAHHCVRNPALVPYAANVNDGKRAEFSTSLCDACAFVHPCWQTRVGGLQRKLFLTFLLRFAGSIVSDIMLFSWTQYMSNRAIANCLLRSTIRFPTLHPISSVQNCATVIN